MAWLRASLPREYPHPVFGTIVQSDYKKRQYSGVGLETGDDGAKIVALDDMNTGSFVA